MRLPHRAAMALLLPALLAACRQKVDVGTKVGVGTKVDVGSKVETRFAAERTRTWLLRAMLDSGEVRAEVTSSAASIEVIAPTGRFLLAYSTSEPVEEWAHAITRLTRARMAAGSSESIAMRSTRDERVAWQLTRHAARRGSPYTLSGSNSAWEFALDLSEAQLDAVLAALTGDSTGAAVHYDFPVAGRGSSGKPMVDGTWLWDQVDSRYQHIAGPEGLHYPPSVAGAPNGGEVTLQCTVDANGRVVPSSIFLILVPDPVLAREARTALLRARFVPARRGGQPVAMMATLIFRFGRH